jgi:hypothetical protein
MTSPGSRRDELGLRIRRERGRHLAPALLDSLATLTGQPFSNADLLSLEETDRLFHQYSSSFQRCVDGKASHRNVRLPGAEANLVFAEVERIGTRARDSHIAFFSKQSEYTGAIRIATMYFFASAERLLAIEVDHLRVSSLDGEQGLLIDSLEREDEVELWCWGHDWTG